MQPQRQTRLLTVVAAVFLITSIAKGASDFDSPANEDVPAAYPEQPKPKKKSNNKRHPLDEEPEAEPSTGKWFLTGGLGLNDRSFGIELTVGYLMNRFVGYAGNAFYSSKRTDDWTANHYGPSLDLYLFAANPSIFTPFVGAGPGYERWQRTLLEQTYDDGSSATANYVLGINIQLAKSFVLQIDRRTTNYLETAPKSLDEPGKRESTYSRLEIKFLLSLQ